MFLSIIIPIYNVGNYLTRCLEALLKQRLDPDVEIICVDDGSTDRSGTICDNYARINGVIRVIHQNNRGIGAARNVGMRSARGTYVAFVDPDDYVATNWYAKIKTSLEKNSCDILLFDHCRLEKGNVEEREYGRQSGFIEREKLLADVTADIVISNSLWQMAFVRKIYEGITFPENVKCMEDYAVLHKIILKASSVYYLHEKLYYYCVREDSLVKAIDWDKSLRCYQIAKERYEFLSAEGYQVSPIGYLVQALGLCRKYNVSGEPRATEKRFNVMGRQIIRRHIFPILADRQCPVEMKLKMILASIGLYNAAVWWKNILKKLLRKNSY